MEMTPMHVSAADRAAGWAVAVVGIAALVGAIRVAAPLFLEDGWASPRGIAFAACSAGALGLAAAALAPVAARVRRRADTR